MPDFSDRLNGFSLFIYADYAAQEGSLAKKLDVIDLGMGNPINRRNWVVDASAIRSKILTNRYLQANIQVPSHGIGLSRLRP